MKLDRMLIDKIENRVLLGVVCFVGMMAVLGWIALNEPARMAAFEAQYLARSVERGARHFNANCANCHGIDGRGQLGVAPALNSPHMFGHDYLADINRETVQLQAEVDRGGLTDERRAEIVARQEALTDARDALIAQMQTAIERGYNPDDASRLAQVGWGGSLNAYIYTTLVHGRPTSVSYWPQGMAAWSQTAGGPLRDDELEDITNYIMNWDRAWTLDDLLAVQQFAKVPLDPLLATVAESDAPIVGTDVLVIAAALPDYTPDAANGEALYNGALYGCAGCHANAAVAPLTQGTYTRVVTERLREPQFEGYTPEEYLIESIVLPNAYIVPGYNAGVMPQNYGERINMQQMADIIAYLQLQTQ